MRDLPAPAVVPGEHRDVDRRTPLAAGASCGAVAVHLPQVVHHRVAPVGLGVEARGERAVVVLAVTVAGRYVAGHLGVNGRVLVDQPRAAPGDVHVVPALGGRTTVEVRRADHDDVARGARVGEDVELRVVVVRSPATAALAEDHEALVLAPASGNRLTALVVAIHDPGDPPALRRVGVVAVHHDLDLDAAP